MTDSWDDLDAYLADDDAERWAAADAGQFDDVPPLENEVEADRDLRALARLASKQSQDERVAQHEHERINSWLARRVEVYDNRRRWIQMRLEGYARAMGRPTLNMPWGRLRLTKASNVKVEIDKGVDEVALAREYPEIALDPSPPKVSKAKVQQVFGHGDVLEDQSGVAEGYEARAAISPRTGEVVPGLRIIVPQEGHRTFRADPLGNE